MLQTSYEWLNNPLSPANQTRYICNRMMNSVDPDDMAHNEPSHLDLHSLLFHSPICNNEYVQFWRWKSLFQKKGDTNIVFLNRSWHCTSIVSKNKLRQENCFKMCLLKCYWLFSWSAKATFDYFLVSEHKISIRYKYILSPLYLELWNMIAHSTLSFWSGIFYLGIWKYPLLQIGLSGIIQEQNAKHCRSWWLADSSGSNLFAKVSQSTKLKVIKKKNSYTKALY